MASTPDDAPRRAGDGPGTDARGVEQSRRLGDGGVGPDARRRLAEIFGDDVRAPDDRDVGWGDIASPDAAADEHYRRNRPPHHG